jgi:predicted peptidase
MRSFHVAVIPAALLLLFGCGRQNGQVADRPGELALEFSGTVTKTVDLKYHLYLPEGYGEDQGTSWPLILFLHGAGERGDDLERVKIHGLLKMLKGSPDFPFILLSPLCPDDSWWTEQIDALDALLDEVLDGYPVDTSRIYLTGLSMGGQGAWYLALAHPERFAAVVPICGWSIPYLGCRLKDVPVWAFHGALDGVVPRGESERMLAAIKGCGGDARLTIYPEAKHDSWTATYTNPELYEWLLGQTK